MAAGDIENFGPFNVGDATAIDAGLLGNVVVADDITAYVASGQVFFTVVKAA